MRILLALGIMAALSACEPRAGADELRLANAEAGVEGYPKKLREALEARWAELGRGGYASRTKHLREDGTPKFTNRLFLESSPYLLQHAHNPVNWYPWGEAAFEAARKLGRPVFLSIGYSTCHWCHVMEEESFEDLEIARYLNENYIAVKVDREERPDVDAIYMAAVQAFTGRGGWPMSVWLTAERKPFFAGTYFPARDGDRGSMKGFLTLLEKLREAYDGQREKVTATGELFAKQVGQVLAPAPGNQMAAARVLESAAKFYAGRFDSKYGGLRGGPKFPSSLPVRFLLREWRRTGERQYLEMAELTLEQMARGGIYDQVGGGFHRYSTDARWLVPHFEKMLYDNALLVVAYLEGYQATGREEFARVAREILRYVERDMTSPEGAFYSATDADSENPAGEREEGRFFTWTPDELEKALGADRANVVGAHYGVTDRGNFEGRNILFVSGASDAVSRDSVDEAREVLYKARKSRPAPLRDEKILAAWNGLMISAYAMAALVLDEPEYARRGERAAVFVLTKMRTGGRLRRSYVDGQARLNGYLEDYAFVMAGLLDLYEATGRVRWIEEAMALDGVLAKHYEDRKGGGFYLTSDDHEVLLAREKPARDGAEPSGNSVMALNLLRLYELTLKETYRTRAERVLRAFEPVLSQAPAALSKMLLAAEFYYGRPKEIVIVTPGGREAAEPLLAGLRKRFVPNRVVAVVSEAEVDQDADLVPLVTQKRARDGKATAYVCERGVCELPTSDPAVFAKQLEAK